MFRILVAALSLGLFTANATAVFAERMTRAIGQPVDETKRHPAKPSRSPVAGSDQSETFKLADNAAIAWGYVKDSTDIETLQLFIQQYGSNPFFARLAKVRIQELQKKAGEEKPTPAPAPAASPPASPPAAPPATTGKVTTEIAYQARGECRRELLSWRRFASIGAFAVERGGGCGWTWGNKDLEEARSAALEYCRKQGPDCRIIEEHTNQPGDWTLSHVCKQHLAEWRKEEKIGAFSVERGGGCGWSFGFTSEREARDRANQECRKQGADCRVVEVH